jgi:hypothetical protein
MTQYVALKSFGYAPDGINIIHIAPGDQRDFGDSNEGLLKEGYIGPVAPAKPAAPVAKAEAPKAVTAANKATLSAAKKA